MNVIMRTPMLLIVLIVYNIVAFTQPTWLSPASSMFTVTLLSGAQWSASFSDILILFAAVILYFELFKSTYTGTSAIVEHVLSLFVFVVFLVEFLIVKECGTSTFLIATLLALIDVIAGFTITISTARRDFGLGAHATPN